MRRRVTARRAAFGAFVTAAVLLGVCPNASSQAAPGASGAASASAAPAASAATFGSAAPAPSAAPASTSAPKSSAAATAGGVCGGSVTPRGGASVKKAASPLPPPTPEKLKILQLLEDEAKQYESGAKDFRRSLTMIVRHHYEERRRETLSAIDSQMSVEKKSLADARDEAIRRFEAFIARYSGPEADPSATPDAMFRLAALYEERARSASDAEIASGLEPAIALYRRIIVEYPKYEELAAVHYYLGHALNDSGRIEEAQQAWRALVCANHFSVKPDPKDASKVLLQAEAQDHDEKFWAEWLNRHPVPFDQPTGGKPRPAGRKVAAAGDDELSFKDPYDACEPVPQKVEPGSEPRYLAEVWWQIGNYHFDQIDPHGGAYNLNRGESAYRHSLEYKKPPLYGVSMYKLAWTYYKQQRYKTGVEWFVNLLHYADEQEAKTGDPGADFRSEAYTYVAGSLTYVDFDGPPPEAPYIPRSDVLDTELDPIKAEQKMAVAIDRVQDASLVPQDKKWTVEIYKALAQEFIEITQNRNAIAVLELTLKKFPMDRDAPVMQNKVAELYDQLSHLSPEGSAARTEMANKALGARTALAGYVGTTPWTDANRDDPEALSQAEQLVRGGLKRAAADHTNYARGYYQKALELNDAGDQRALIEKSVDEYRLAETGWNAYIEQDPTSQDVYESRFWLADARYWVVVLQVAIGKSPSATEVDSAR